MVIAQVLQIAQVLSQMADVVQKLLINKELSTQELQLIKRTLDQQELLIKSLSQQLEMLAEKVEKLNERG